MEDSIGIIAVYKVLIGPNAGKIYKTRFETIAGFVAWDREYEMTGKVELLNTKVVDSERVYWDDRWIIAAKAN